MFFKISWNFYFEIKIDFITVEYDVSKDSEYEYPGEELEILEEGGGQKTKIIYLFAV